MSTCSSEGMSAFLCEFRIAFSNLLPKSTLFNMFYKELSPIKIRTFCHASPYDTINFANHVSLFCISFHIFTTLKYNFRMYKCVLECTNMFLIEIGF